MSSSIFAPVSTYGMTPEQMRLIDQKLAALARNDEQ